MLGNVKVTGGLNIEFGQIDPKVTGGLKNHFLQAFFKEPLMVPQTEKKGSSVSDGSS